MKVAAGRILLSQADETVRYSLDRPFLRWAVERGKIHKSKLGRKVCENTGSRLQMHENPLDEVQLR